MRIRLGLIDNDTRYTSLLASFFNKHYAERLELYVFDSFQSFMQNSRRSRVDVLLANPNILEGTEGIPSNVSVAYLSQSPDVESIRGVRAVCRFQKADLIYREVLSIYSEIEKGEVYRMGDTNSRILLFRGVSGGVGTTTTAVACAISLAKMGKSVLYLNLEENGVISHLLRGEGNDTLTDVLFVVKSGHSNITLKLGSKVKKDDSGVYFFEPFRVMLDGCSLSKEDVKQLIDALRISGSYDYIVLDLNRQASDVMQYVMNLAEKVILVCDGSEASVEKAKRLIEALAILDDRDEGTILRRTCLLYNRFGSKGKEVKSNPQLDVLGKIKKCEGASDMRVRDFIVGTGILSRCI